MKEIVRVLHLSDLHYCSSPADDGLYHQMLAKVKDPLQKACRILREEKPDLVVLSGDITDGGSAADYALVKKTLTAAAGDAVILPVLGNHDRKDCFRTGWLQEQPDSAPLHWVKNISGFTLIGIDNSQFGEEDGFIWDSELAWLRGVLEDARDIIICMHHPLQGREGVPELRDKEKLMRVLRPHTKEIRMVLCGHTHWDDQYTVDGIVCSTAPSLSFRGENTGSCIDFYDSCGFREYALKNHSVSILKAVSQVKEKIDEIDSTKLRKELAVEAA